MLSDLGVVERIGGNTDLDSSNLESLILGLSNLES